VAMRKNLFTFLFIMFFIIFGALYVYLFRGTTQDVIFLTIDSVKVSDHSITISAFNPNSGMMITGCDSNIKDKTVYLKIRGAIANQYSKSINEKNISIDGNF
jgi:hypothetical protein